MMILDFHIKFKYIITKYFFSRTTIPIPLKITIILYTYIYTLPISETALGTSLLGKGKTTKKNLQF